MSDDVLEEITKRMVARAEKTLKERPIVDGTEDNERELAYNVMFLAGSATASKAIEKSLRAELKARDERDLKKQAEHP